MKDFALDSNGDVLIENNAISIVTGNELLRQKVWSILRTNLGEWFFDWHQGVDFKNLLGKETTEDLVRYEIERGLDQVDSTFVITEFSYEAEPNTRMARVRFSAHNGSGEEVGGEFGWD